MNIYCDESGGVGRGVMTMAAIAIAEQDAEGVLARFREASGLKSELKGSRIDLEERTFLFELLSATPFHATVGIAISAIKPDQGVDRGDHDIAIYAALLDDTITRLLPMSGGCAQVVIDDGRYGPETLALVRGEIAEMIGPFGSAKLEVSHSRAGLQIADVIANTFFNRALVSERQGRMAAIAKPFLENGRIAMRVLGSDAEPNNQGGEQT